MATPSGRTDPSVADTLLAQPWDFNFFQAVRLLASMYPRQRLIAGFGQPPEEVARFHAHLSMLFPASAVQNIKPDPSEKKTLLHLTVNFLGLTGPQGVLPAYYTEFLMAQGPSGDTAASAFFDLFNHRLISLFFLAWEKHHFPIAYERGVIASSGPSRFTQYLFDLIGMGTLGLRGRLEVADTALLSYGGLIAQRPHSAASLEGILCDYFQVPVEVEQFVGKWCTLEAHDLSYLDANGDYGQLGSGAVLGDRVWNQQGRFRIQIGPLNWERFNNFVPGEPAFRELVGLARYFAGQALDFEVQLILLGAEVPACRMEDGPGPPRLGLSSWLRTIPFQEDARDLIMTVRPSDIEPRPSASSQQSELY